MSGLLAATIEGLTARGKGKTLRVSMQLNNAVRWEISDWMVNGVMSHEFF